MSSVTQTIPTLTGGLSQQPDELKIPGQVNSATNVLPDVTHGLLKRSGSKLLASLSDGTSATNSQTNGRWFSYYRDETESYIGQVSRSGDVNMWDCATGAPMVVNFDSGTASALANYLTHTDDQDIQTLTLNDFTFITNRTKTVAMSSTVEPVRPPEVFIDLKATAYARQYAVNLYDTTTTQPVKTVTRINVDLIKSSNNYCDNSGGSNQGNILTHNLRVSNSGGRCGEISGDNRDAFAPNVGTRVFDIEDGSAQTDIGPSNPTTPYNYTIDVKNDTYGVSGSTITGAGTGSQTQNISTLTGVLERTPKNLYFRIRTIGQSVPFTKGSGQNQETTYQARYTTTFDLLYGGQGWEVGDYFYVWMKDGYYKITVDAISAGNVQSNLGLVRPDPTPFDTETTITAESILADIRTGILGTSYDGVNDLYQFRDDPSNDYEVKQIGNGLYVTRPTSEGVFNITAPSSDLLNVMSTEVKDVSELPEQCKHGYVVKVANSEADEDDYYVKFFGAEKADGSFLDGYGVWEECNKPGRKIEFDSGTMPIQLVRRVDDASGTITGTAYGLYFTVEQVSWDQSTVGENPTTNPEPSFVGNTINQLVFFRNRLVFLSDENVIMSRPGDFFNFWSKTATTFTPTDVIDLSCSSEYPAVVFDGIQINAGLLLFTKNQQFMLTTDSDILSPETAKINSVASYNFNAKTNPVSLGTTIAFLDNANKFSRFFEMSNILRQGEPEIVEQSKVIGKLLEKDISIISESRENSVVFFSKKGTDTIYGFRYFTSGDSRLLQSWFVWKIPGSVQYHCMLDDSLFVVTRETVSGTHKDQLLKIPLVLDDNGHFVTDTQGTTDTDDDVIHRVHLDHMSSVTAAVNTYNTTTKKTTIPKPNGYVHSTKQLVAYDTDAGNELGRYQKITVNGSNLEIQGDWSDNTFVIGYLYEMDVQIPTLYVTQQVGDKYRADAKSSLIIHRIKFSFGPLGVYSTTLKRLGKDDYTEERELGLAGFVSANRLAVVDDVIETIPCYERNTSLTVNIKSSHPSPATLYSLSWEGDYSNRFYRRV